MVGLRFADMRLRPTEFLDFTSLTVEEFQILIPPFEVAFQAHMTLWCLDGTPRTNRRFSVYRTCPLATPEDRLFFLLTYHCCVKNYMKSNVINGLEETAVCEKT